MGYNRALYTTVMLKGSRAAVETMLLPSFPAIAIAMHTTKHWIQLSVTAYIVGLLFAKLFVSHFADNSGPRRALLVMLPFMLAGALLSLIPDVTLFITGRLLQGFGLGGTTSLSITILKYTYDREAFKEKLAMLDALTAWTPAIAAVAGGIIQFYLDWQTNLFFIAALAIILLFSTARLLPAQRVQKIPRANSEKSIIKFQQLLTKPLFLMYSVIYSLLISGQSVFYILLPFIMISEWRMKPYEFSLSLAALYFGNFGGMLTSAQLQKYYSHLRIIFLSLCITSISIFFLAVAYILKLDMIFLTILSLLIYGFGSALTLPAIEVNVSGILPNSPSTATAILGLVLAVITILTTVVVIHLPGNSFTVMTLFLGSLVMLCWIALIFCRKFAE